MTTANAIAALGAAIARRIGDARYRLWFDGKTRFACDGDCLTVGVPNRFFQEWLQKSFSAAVESAAAEFLGAPLTIRYVIDPQLFQEQRREAAAVQAESTTIVAPATPLASPAPNAPFLKPERRWLHLEDFVVGPANRLAHAAALDLIDNPGTVATPLTVYGPSGSGKTHLLEGIHQGLCRRWHLNTDQVLYLTAEEFTNRFLSALHSKQSGNFRKQFRQLRALLLDDVHFLAGKQSTQMEFLHTLETLRSLGRPVAAACEAHPRLVPGLLTELSSRLLGGSVWPLASPDRETRAGIVRTKARNLQCPLSDEAAYFLADQVSDNIRELVGALHTVHHYHRVHRVPITPKMIAEAIGDLMQHTNRAIQLGDVENVLSATLELPRNVLHSRTTARPVCYPRMLAMYLARKHIGLSYKEIGRYFGRRSHGTVIAAERKVLQWLTCDATFFVGGQRWAIRELLCLVEKRLTERSAVLLPAD